MPPNYFTRTPKGIVVTGRPSNQSAKKVRQRVAAKTRAAITRNKPLSIRRFEREFATIALKKMNAGAGVDMAHVASANELGELIAHMGRLYEKSTSTSSTARNKISKVMADFADGYISSDAEDAPEVKKVVRKAFPTFGAVVDLGAASVFFYRINRTSRNLFGGDASRNRSIGLQRDIPTLLDGTQPTYISDRLVLLDKTWGGSANVPRHYAPRMTPGGGYFSSTTNK